MTPRSTPEVPAWLSELGSQADRLLRAHPDRFALMIEAWAEQFLEQRAASEIAPPDTADGASAAPQRQDRAGARHASDVDAECQELASSGEQVRGTVSLNERGPLALLERGEEVALHDMYAVVAAVHSAVLPSFAGRWGGHHGPAFVAADGTDEAELSLATPVALSDPAAYLVLLLSRHVASTVENPQTGDVVARSCPASLSRPIHICMERIEADLSRTGGAETSQCRHSPDFTSVVWYGQTYQFSKGNQAEAVRLLWDAWKNGTPSLSQATIAEGLGGRTDNFSMQKTFRRWNADKKYEQHPAWNKMIVSAGKGLYRLADLD